MKKSIRDILKILAYSAFIVGVWLSSQYSYKKEQEILKEGKSVIGQLYLKKKTGHSFFKYFVDGIEYSCIARLMKPYTFVEGETYQINYFLEKPKDGVVDLRKPIFDVELYFKGETKDYRVMRKVREEGYVLIE
ncbi:MAG: hypothetical protein AB8G22_20350, partial [Saprospiraceae bacterium]